MPDEPLDQPSQPQPDRLQSDQPQPAVSGSSDARPCPQCGDPLPPDSVSVICPRCLLKMGFESLPEQPSGDSDQRAYQPAFVPPTPEYLAPHFPQLEILEQIGHGGMGVVYKARQRELDRIVALKILRPGIEQTPGFAERFQREARALARLNHPNIITIHDFGRKDGLYFFVMEYVDGANLRQIERSGNLEPQEALAIVPQVCAALQYAHDNGIVHRDIKPENILLTKSGQVRIADFGLAKLAGKTDDPSLTGTWQVMGTPHYMAPEQFERPTTVDHRADIFSLGVVIYELLTGELPLGRFHLPSEKVQVDVRLDEVVLRSLEKEPDRRYQRVTEVATAVENASRPADVPAFAERVSAAVSKGARDVSQRAASLGTQAAGLRDKVQQQVSHWDLVGIVRHCGTVLVLAGLLEVLAAPLAILLLLSGPRPEVELLFYGSWLLTGTVAVLAGLNLRHRQNVGMSAVLLTLCLVPTLPFVLLRLPLVLLAAVLLLRNDVRRTFQNVPWPQSQAAQDLKHYAGTARNLVQNRLPRIVSRVVLLTGFGLLGWTLVTLAVFLLATSVWLNPRIPVTYYIDDDSAMFLAPRSDAYRFVRIDADDSGFSAGRPTQADQLTRDRLQLTLQPHEPDLGPVQLRLDFAAGTAMLLQDGTIVARDLPIARETVTDWYALAQLPQTDDTVRAEAANLYDLITVMETTAGVQVGVPEDLTSNHRSPQPTAPVFSRSAAGTRWVMSEGPLPVGSLVDPAAFENRSRSMLPRVTVRADDAAETAWNLAWLGLWVLGLIGLLGILFHRLWFPPALRISDAAERTSVINRQLRRPRRGLILSGLINVIVVLLAYQLLIDLPLQLPRQLQQISIPTVIAVAAGSLLVLCAVIVVGGLATRRRCGRVGRLAGLTGSAVSMLLFPGNLIGFPLGFLAWTTLTDPVVKQEFSTPTSPRS